MSEKYEKNFLDLASKLDAMTTSCGETMKLANRIIEDGDDEAAKQLVVSFLHIIESSKDYEKECRLVAKSLKDSLIDYYGYCKIKSILDENVCEKENTKDLAELLAELKSLVGLTRVKEKVKDLMAYQCVQKARGEYGLVIPQSTLHLAFVGNPGTGKTTVARIIGRIYKQIGLLSKGHFIEVSRTDLIAGYQGQTALKVKKVIEEAKGGVLFIDEAYSLTENDHSDSYGRECLTELTKALEDYRDDLVVIVAGYTEPMNNFFNSNPGLKSRFNTIIEFDDYSADELIEIMEVICRNNDYILDESLKNRLTEYFNSLVVESGDNFANARLVRNLYEDMVMNHARRVVKIDKPSKNDLSILLSQDFSVS